MYSGVKTVRREIVLRGVPYLGEWNRGYTKEGKMIMVYVKWKIIKPVELVGWEQIYCR